MIPGALLVIALHIYAVSGRECYITEEKIYTLTDSKTLLSWTEALAECSKTGKTLATIKNEQEFDAFQYKLLTTGSHSMLYWIGASCEDKCGAGNRDVWYWVTDRSKLDETEAVTNNWGTGEPDDYNNTERVLLVRTENTWARPYEWDDRSYATKALWICQECKPKISYLDLKNPHGWRV